MDEGVSWQGTRADTLTSSSASSESGADSRSSSEEQFDIGKSRRQWSTNKFAQRITQSAALGGDDKALADILNAFPDMSGDAATLWLAYMKETVSVGRPVDDCIMRLFPVVNWHDVLADEDSRRLFPEIYRLLSSAKEQEPVQNISTGPQINGTQAHRVSGEGERGFAATGSVEMFEGIGRVPVKRARPYKEVAGPTPHAMEMARSLCETVHNRGPVNIVVGNVVVHSIRL